MLKKIRKAGRKCGLAFKFETNIHKYEKLIKFCDYVVIMGVNPGFGGRSFDDRAIKQLEAINEIKKKKYNLSLNVKLDGGVNYDVIKKTFDYVDNFVSGTFLLKLKSPKELVNFINKIEQK